MAKKSVTGWKTCISQLQAYKQGEGKCELF